MKKQVELTGRPKDDLKAMRILTAALSVGVVFFSVIMIFTRQFTGKPPLSDKQLGVDKNTLLIIVTSAAATGIVVARLLYRKRINAIKQSGKSLTDKLNQYRTALILYLAICEVAAFLSVMFFFLTGNFTMLIITGIMLIAMLSKMPFTKKVIGELDLDWKEQEEME